MAWLEIDKKAEAVMQAAERKIREIECIKADIEPPWDGFCGLVRVCDDEELKERGIVRAVVRPAPAAGAPDHGRDSTVPAGTDPLTPGPAPADTAVPAGTASGAAGTCGGAAVCSNSSVLPASTATSQQEASGPWHAADGSGASDATLLPAHSAAAALPHPQKPAPAPAPASAPALAPAPAPAPSPTADDVDVLKRQQTQQQQQQQQFPPGNQQQQQQEDVVTSSVGEPVSIASCLQLLAGGAAADELADVSSGPSWVASYLMGGDSSDSDGDNTVNDSHGGARGCNAAQTSQAAGAAAEGPHLEQAAAVLLQGSNPDSTAQPEQAADSGSQNSGKEEEERVEQLLQEALAAAEAECEQEQQQQQHGAGTGAAAEAAATAAQRVEDGARLLPAAAAAVTAGEAAAPEEHAATLDMVAGAIFNLISFSSGSSDGGCGGALAAAAAAGGGGGAAAAYHGAGSAGFGSEVADLLNAAADAAALEAKHAVAAPGVGHTTSLENVGPSSEATAAPGAVTGAGDTATAAVTGDEVAELLSAAADAAALEAKHAAPGTVHATTVVSAAADDGGSGLQSAPDAGAAACVGVSQVCGAAADSTDLTSGDATGSSDTFDQQVTEQLAAAADSAALQAKHAPAMAGAAAAAASDTASAALEDASSEDEVQQLLAAVADDALLDAKHAAIASAAAPSVAAGSAAFALAAAGAAGDGERDNAEYEEQEEDLHSSSTGDDSDSSSYSSSDDEEREWIDGLPIAPSHTAVVQPQPPQQQLGGSSSGGGRGKGSRTRAGLASSKRRRGK